MMIILMKMMIHDDAHVESRIAANNPGQPGQHMNSQSADQNSFTVDAFNDQLFMFVVDGTKFWKATATTTTTTDHPPSCTPQ